jgi:hypothetical protein
VSRDRADHVCWRRSAAEQPAVTVFRPPRRRAAPDGASRADSATFLRRATGSRDPNLWGLPESSRYPSATIAFGTAFQDRNAPRPFTRSFPSLAVKSISGNQISVESGTRIIAVATDDHTEVWKGKTFHDLSPVLIGDDFSARCRADTSGKLVAELIELNVVNFFGVITKVDVGGERFEMLTNPNADPQSGYVKKKLQVSVDADTLFDASATEDLKLGRDVQMVGLDLKNGTIRATRLTVYEGNRPVRMGNGKVLPPTGPPK